MVTKRRVVSVALALVAMVQGAAVGHSAARQGSTAARASISLAGHGNGHGIGLSQWGAYGYAVDYGWTAAQILDRYYGGTVAATADPIEMTVRLTALDDAQTATVHDRGAIVVDGVSGGPWPSVVARESAAGSYTVWARSDARVCPSAADDLTVGWTQIATGVASVMIRASIDTYATADVADLLAVCEPSGKVRSYRGAIRAVNGTAGENRTVNHIAIEQYLRPVVAVEMSASWAAKGGGRGAQALQAQAIASRSYASSENKYSYAKTCDDECQGYFGAAWRDGVSGRYVRVEQAATDAAVAATAGTVRRVGSTSGPIAHTMFSSSSGGWTAASTLGFPAVEDLGDATASNPYHSWTTTLDTTAISTAWPAIGTFTGIAVTRRAGGGEWGGRVASMVVSGSAGSVTITGEQFRRAMGLRSSWFNVTAGDPPSTAPPSTTEPTTTEAGGPPATTPAPPSSPPAAAPAACGSRVPPAIDATGAATAAAAARLRAMSPVRLVDTREDIGTAGGLLGRGCTIVVKPPVAASTTAVAINVTTVNSEDNGFLTAYPCGIERPVTATVQPLVGLVVGGAALVPLGANGTFCLFANVPTDVVIDLFGAFAPDAAGRFEPIAPVRRYDSRPGGSRLAAGSIVRVNVRGASAPDATAVALTVHALDAASGGFVTAWPCDTAQPFVSAANVAAGASVTNHVEVSIGASGEVCLFLSAAMHLVVDMSGWYGPSGSTELHAVRPFRVADTRVGQGWSGPFTRNVSRTITVSGVGGVPAASSVRAIAGQVTAVDATGAGYLTIHPCQATAPDLSMLRYPATRNVAVLVTGATDASGRWCLVTNARTHLVIDVTGWFG